MNKGGNGKALFPAGVESVEDLPSDLSLAIEHANLIASWQENLMTEDMPPRWMWHLDWELERWFEELERSKKSGSNFDEDISGPVMENELSARFKR
jgi:hypothetical protein